MAFGVGCGVAVVLMGLGAFAVGHVGDNEARVLLEAMMPTSRFLSCDHDRVGHNLSAHADGSRYDPDVGRDEVTFYRRIQQIAFYDMLLLTTATCFLVLHCMPITKSDELPAWWYPTVYYSLLAVSAILAGAMVSVVAMLYATLRDLIHRIGIEPRK